MISTILLLFWTGIGFFMRGKIAGYKPGELISLGIFSVAFGIIFYIVRDIFVQLGMYDLQLKLLKIGGFFHILGGIIIFWFVFAEFAWKKAKIIMLFISASTIILLVIGFLVVPTTSEIGQAPFEPLAYEIVRNFVEIRGGGLVPGFLLSLWLIICPLALISVIALNSFKLENKQERRKGLFYGLGFLFLFLPMFVCITISPIYARWGYLIGSALLFRGSRIKI
jgi:vacuolar-type H+-ATPase subunit I/STV1